MRKVPIEQARQGKRFSALDLIEYAHDALTAGRITEAEKDELVRLSSGKALGMAIDHDRYNVVLKKVLG